MSEFKNYDTQEKKLKKADSRKISDTDTMVTVSEITGGKKTRTDAIMMPVASVKKKRFPIVVDVIVAVAMLLIVAAIIVGAYLLFTHYTNSLIVVCVMGK